MASHCAVETPDVALEVLLADALGGGPDDHARLVGDDPLEDLLEALALGVGQLAADPGRPAGGHVHEEAAGQADLGGQARALVAHRVLGDLDEHLVARGQRLLDLALLALEAGGVPVDLTGVQDGVAPAADVDERGLHRREHVLHPAEVDVADHRVLAVARHEVLDEHPVLEHPDLAAAGVLAHDHRALDGLAPGEELGLGQDRRPPATGLAPVAAPLALGLETRRALDPADLVVRGLAALGPLDAVADVGDGVRRVLDLASPSPSEDRRRRRRRRREPPDEPSESSDSPESVSSSSSESPSPDPESDSDFSEPSVPASASPSAEPSPDSASSAPPRPRPRPRRPRRRRRRLPSSSSSSASEESAESEASEESEDSDESVASDVSDVSEASGDSSAAGRRRRRREGAAVSAAASPESSAAAAGVSSSGEAGVWSPVVSVSVDSPGVTTPVERLPRRRRARVGTASSDVESGARNIGAAKAGALAAAPAVGVPALRVSGASGSLASSPGEGVRAAAASATGSATGPPGGGNRSSITCATTPRSTLDCALRAPTPIRASTARSSRLEVPTTRARACTRTLSGSAARACSSGRPGATESPAAVLPPDGVSVSVIHLLRPRARPGGRGHTGTSRGLAVAAAGDGHRLRHDSAGRAGGPGCRRSVRFGDVCAPRPTGDLPRGYAVGAARSVANGSISSPRSSSRP